MLKLQTRDIPHVNFRRTLPKWLGDGKKRVFLEIDARAAGAINPAYAKQVEALVLRGQIMDRKMQKLEGDDEGYVMANYQNVRQIGRERVGILYDACVIEWRCNILDDGKPITCDREHFMALADVDVPEIAKAITDFEAECREAGRIIEDEDEDTAKN